MEPEHTPAPAPTQRKHLAPRTKTALWLLIGPTVTIMATLTLFIILNIAFGNIPQSLPAGCQTEQLTSVNSLSTECEEALMSLQSTPELAVNVILIIVGSIGVLSWLPGIIIGSILLATKPKKTDTTTE